MEHIPTDPRITVHRIYTKNHQCAIQGLSAHLEGAWKPVINLKANPNFTKLDSQQYEVVLSLQITGEQSKELGFQIYIEQAGLFTLDNVSTEQIPTVLHGVCSNLLFPYAGVILNHWLADAGFPPVYLAPMDFVALYKKHQEEKQAA